MQTILGNGAALGVEERAALLEWQFVYEQVDASDASDTRDTLHRLRALRAWARRDRDGAAPPDERRT